MEKSQNSLVTREWREHLELSEKVENLQIELREVCRTTRARSPRRRGVPFGDDVMVVKFPTSFRHVTIEFGGITDPWGCYIISRMG